MTKKKVSLGVPMFKSIQLRNFKCYRDSGVVPLKPLTILIGANNVGKSTILQALLLLKQTLSDRSSRAALVTSGTYVDLNGYYDILHGKLDAPQGQRQLGISLTLEADNRFDYFLGLSEQEIVKKSRTPVFDTLDWDFEYSDKANEIQVSRFRQFRGDDLLTEVTDQGKKWKSGKASSDTHPDIVAGFEKFLPSIPPYREVKSVKKGKQVRNYQIVNGSFQTYYWSKTLSGIHRVDPVRLRMPWYTGVGARTSSNFGQGGENLVNALGNKEKTQKSNRTLLELVDSWISTRLEVLGRLHLENVDSAGTVRMLLGDERDGIKGINVAAMGEGISQVLPILASALSTNPQECLIVEQPEIHLHPRLQANLADLFIEATTTASRQIILETHSEHLLLRVRRRIAEGKIKPEQVAILFVEKEGPDSTVRELQLNDRGHFDEGAWPKGFFDEAYQEAMALAEASSKKPRK